tara:strand:- start:4660 stop:4989 length:330 start_codon:yes stop_codon:yes gene_type:complete
MKQKITIPVNSITKYLSIWNGIFQLTPMELRILSAFIEVQETTEESNMCSLSNKKEVARIIGMSDYNTLNNYIKKLKDKGSLLYNNKKYTLNRLLNTKNTEIGLSIQWT